MTALARRNWVPDPIEDYVLGIADATSRERSDKVDGQIHALIDENRRIHEDDCVNLNPATNVMNPRAEAALAPVSARGPRSAIPAINTRWGSRRSSRSR